MPSRTKREANTMKAAAHDPQFAAKKGIKQSVAREFVAADKQAGKFQGSSRTTSPKKPRK